MAKLSEMRVINHQTITLEMLNTNEKNTLLYDIIINTIFFRALAYKIEFVTVKQKKLYY